MIFLFVRKALNLYPSSLLRMLGFLFEFKSCQMVAPATVATLRTTEIVVAFVAQILLTHKSTELFDTLGSNVCICGRRCTDIRETNL